MSEYNPQAVELNEQIRKSNPDILELLSDRGRGIYFPKGGIIKQTAEAKGKKYNATIGMAVEDDGSPMRFASIAKKIDLDSAAAFTYATTTGVPELRKAWHEALFQKNPGLKAKTSLPMVTHALTHGLSMAGYLFVNPGEPIWMTDQFWGNYRQIFENTWEGKIKTFNTFKSGCFDSESLQKTLEANPGKQILLLNFPNNPAGYTPTIAEADAIVAAIRASAKRGNRIVAILDDAYFGLVYEPGVLAESLFSRLADLDERVLAVKLDGPTKEDYVWGFRVGFITFACKGISDETCRALEEKTAGAIRGTISNASHLSQSLILAGMRSPDYQDEKKRKFEILRSRFITVKSWLAKNKNRTENVFNPMPFNSGYFMCVELAPGLDAEAIRKNLLAKFDTGLISSGNTLRIAYSSLGEKDIPKVFENILAACREAD